MTYHRVINDGSVIQAAALFAKLREAFPDAVVEVIDYLPRSLMHLNRRTVFRQRTPGRILRQWRRKRELDRFLERHVRLSPRFVSDDLQSAQAWLETLGYDLVVVGSDTVWSLHQQKGFPPPPNLFFSPIRQSTAPLIAYAVSADPLQQVPEEVAAMAGVCAEHWRRFSFIGYRDQTTGDVLGRALGAGYPLHEVPDPTFHVPLEPYVVPCNLPGSRPVLGISVGFCHRRILQEIAAAAGKAGVRLIDFNGTGLSDQGMPSMPAGPGRRLGVLEQCSALLTDRFHLSIFFARLTRRPMVFVEHDVKWPYPNSKGRDLYRKLAIPDCVIRATRDRILDLSPAELIDRLTDPGCPCPNDTDLVGAAEKSFRFALEHLGGHPSLQG